MKSKISIVLLVCILSAILFTGCSNSQETVAVTSDDTYENVVDATFLNSISQPSTIFNKDLALICAHLSQEIENVYDSDDANRIINEYKKIGITEENIYTLPNNKADNYYSIACINGFDIDGEKYNVLFVTARGTGTSNEAIDDFKSRTNSEFFGYAAFDDSYRFYQKIQSGIEDEFLNTHPFLKKGKLKVVVTGHSLGGSAANLVAAAFNKCLDTKKAWWSELTTKNDIYCYTFGSIGSIDDRYYKKGKIRAYKNRDPKQDMIDGNVGGDVINNMPVNEGFENIHNVYNYYDSFGPNGSWFALNNGTIGNGRNESFDKKFGHIELFGKSEYWKEKYADKDNLSTNQHSMATYIDALNDPSKSGLKTCNDIRGIKEPETNTQKVEEKPKASEEEKQQKTENEEKPREKAEDYIVGLWEAGTDSGIEFDEDGVFYFDWSYNYGYTEEGFYSIGEWTSDKSFIIELDGTSLILLMKTIYGAFDSSYHFEVLIRDDNKAYLVQVSGDKTAETSSCKLPLKRIEE